MDGVTTTESPGDEVIEKTTKDGNLAITLSMECWAAWSNIHYLCPWLPLALRVESPEAMEQGAPPKPAEMERIKAALVQQEFAL